MFDQNLFPTTPQGNQGIPHTDRRAPRLIPSDQVRRVLDGLIHHVPVTEHEACIAALATLERRLRGRRSVRRVA